MAQERRSAVIPNQRNGERNKSNFDEYLRLQWKLLRMANEKSAAASRKWDSLSAAFKAKAEAEGWAYDLKQFTDRKAENYTLKAYADEAEWWRKESIRISGTIRAELALMEYFSDV